MTRFAATAAVLGAVIVALAGVSPGRAETLTTRFPWAFVGTTCSGQPVSVVGETQMTSHYSLGGNGSEHVVLDFNSHGRATAPSGATFQGQETSNYQLNFNTTTYESTYVHRLILTPTSRSSGVLDLDDRTVVKVLFHIRSNGSGPPVITADRFYTNCAPQGA